MNVAFIGLGTMGSGMAIQLAKAGLSLTVFNRTRDRAKPLLDLGASLAVTPEQAAKAAEIVISMDGSDRKGPCRERGQTPC